MRGVLKAFVKGSNASESEIRAWVEFNLEPGMIWANYGRGAGRWGLTRVLARRELASDAEFRHYTNLEPAWNGRQKPSTSVADRFELIELRHEAFCRRGLRFTFPSTVRAIARAAEWSAATAWQDYAHALDIGEPGAELAPSPDEPPLGTAYAREHDIVPF